MSFSFSVPAGPSADFTARAEAALAAYQSASEANDYMLTQLASGLAEEAITAAQGILDSGKLGADGTVSASLSGHSAQPGTPTAGASSVNVSISLTPAPAPTGATPAATG